MAGMSELQKSENGCALCPHRCNVLRKQSLVSNDGALGFCRMPVNPVLARAALHFGEEPCLSMPNGSGTVFFSGCTLQCRICQNYTISHDRFGMEVSQNRLAEIFWELQDKGAQNINLVSGTQFVPVIVRALAIAKPTVPVVWNSSGYEKVNTVKMLDGFVQIYLPDFKYADDELGMRISGVVDYSKTALAAIRAMVDQIGPAVIADDGRMMRGVMVRHLILPGHADNTIAAI